jgi:hypothetical protein
MSRLIVATLLVAVVVLAGCVGGFGGQETATPATTSEPTVDSTAVPATTAPGAQETMSAVTSTATVESTDGSTGAATATTSEQIPPVTFLSQGYPTGGSGLVSQAGGPRGEPVLAAGEPVEVTVRIENRERRPMNYTTVIQIKRLQLTDADPNVTERWTLAQFPVSVDAGESNETVQTITPNMSGEEYLRLDTLVYAGDTPATPTRENAYNNSDMQQPAFSSIPINVTTDDLTPAAVTTNQSG